MLSYFVLLTTLKPNYLLFAQPSV